MKYLAALLLAFCVSIASCSKRNDPPDAHQRTRRVVTIHSNDLITESSLQPSLELLAGEWEARLEGEEFLLRFWDGRFSNSKKLAHVDLYYSVKESSGTSGLDVEFDPATKIITLYKPQESIQVYYEARERLTTVGTAELTSDRTLRVKAKWRSSFYEWDVDTTFVKKADAK